MVEYFFDEIYKIFLACSGWFSDLMGAVNGFGLVLAGILIVLVVNLILKPLRGSGLNSFGDFNVNAVNRSKPKTSRKSD